MLQGDHEDTVFVLIDGSVKITLDTADGREVVLAVRHPGDVLGEFEALAPESSGRAAANIALEPVEVRVLTGESFLDYLVEHPKAALALLRTAIRRIRTADRRRIDATALDTTHRLAHFLLEHIGEHSDVDPRATVVDIPLTQEELAGVIASSRDSVVRALSTLRTRGLIETRRREITIRDVEGLRRYAGDR